jgi:sodium/hydrogen antiporter
MILGILILCIFTLGFAMIAKRLSSTIVTAPMVFLLLGYIVSMTDILPSEEAEVGLHLVAEITLIVLLFLDAAQIDLVALRRRHVWPVRMLAIGLPVSMALGTLVAIPFLPGWPLAGVALVAAILAPTDAALGQAVVTNPIVPERVRRALTVESGVNDGLALPAVLLFASLTAMAMSGGSLDWALFGAQQLLLGPLAGVVVGLAGGKLLLMAKDHNFTSEIYEGIGALALAGIAYIGATLIGGNGFISAFVAGLCFGNMVRGRCRFIFEFVESEGQMLTWCAFFLLGLVLVPDALRELSIEILVLILISLFIVRPVAIWISLIGTDAALVTRLFFGWFGPRGLATALFALLVMKDIGMAFSDQVINIAINTVWISALLHGMTAVPGAKWYANKIRAMGDCPETRKIEASAKPLITIPVEDMQVSVTK